jgi:Na+/proline symporter
LVAIAMIGTSISGVSFVSVPGMVGGIHFTYLQTVFGFFVGYLLIAQVLLPLYYRMNLTSIYVYLKERFGEGGHKTGAFIFLISKSAGAAARLFIVALILQKMVFDAWNLPFVVPVVLILFFIWLYTYRSGIKSIVWTDMIQAIILIISLVLMVIQLIQMTNFSIGEFLNEMNNNSLTQVFVFDDWYSKQNFFKQFFSGIFIAVVMTGLDQDMMQKNLTCKSLPEAQKNMRWYGFAFIPVNLLFLMLGFAVLLFAHSHQIQLPAKGDEILPFMALQYFSEPLMLIFVLGIAAAALSSADSALASLTTSFYVDILGKDNDNAKAQNKQAKGTRMIIHGGFTLLFVAIILIFKSLNNTSVIDAIYIMASYTYGPMLGLFAFGIFTKIKAVDKLIPYIAIISPLSCFLLNSMISSFTGYSFGYELLLLNGIITFTLLLITSGYGNKKRKFCHQ